MDNRKQTAATPIRLDDQDRIPAGQLQLTMGFQQPKAKIGINKPQSGLLKVKRTPPAKDDSMQTRIWNPDDFKPAEQ